MDGAPIISQLAKLWWIIPMLLVAGVLNSRWFKGVKGEMLVSFAGRLRLPSRNYHLIANITLPTRDGTTQIDQLVISPFGVFVIESKHMKGWIFGSERDAQWTQKIFRNSFRFQNPLRQNYKHVKVVEEVLDIHAGGVHSIVVFSGDCKFMTPMPRNVFRRGSYIDYIKSFREPVLADSRVREILETLNAVRLPETFRTRWRHMRNLRIPRVPFVGRICPRCGSPMVLRTAKRSQYAGRQFWGCSTYPECKEIQNVS
jgi:restriction system protein